MDVDSLPARALSRREVSELNRADPVALAVAVDDEDPASGVLVATDSHVTGLALEDAADGDGSGQWRAVVRLPVGDRDRYEALRAAESAVREALGGGAAGPADVDADSPTDGA
jgi:hypothetical protein